MAYSNVDQSFGPHCGSDAPVISPVAMEQSPLLITVVEK
jgi:hypothetical protein